MIQITDLCKTYSKGKKKALDSVNLSINDGEVFGLIGPNGAGKTTLMQCMLGLTKPTQGEVLINGLVPEHLRVREIIAFLPERPLFESWMTPRQFLYYHHMLAKQPDRTAKKDVEEALAAVQLDEEACKRKIKTFSRGMLQKLGLAQMLIGRPKLCFLDEPTSGLDPLSRNLVRSVILKWKQQGSTVVLNSHHLDEVERVCDRVAFIQQGQIKVVETTLDIGADRISVIVSWCGPADACDRMKEIAAQSMFEWCPRDARSAVFILNSRLQIPILVRSLVDAQIDVEQVFIERSNLESLFTEGRLEGAKG